MSRSRSIRNDDDGQDTYIDVGTRGLRRYGAAASKDSRHMVCLSADDRVS